MEPRPSERVDHLLKLLLVGDSSVGKSSLLVSFFDGVFEPLSPTIGVDFKCRVVQHEQLRLKLTVWDTAGQERFRTLTSSYYRGAQGIIFVYDLTSPDSFDNLSSWLREAKMYASLDSHVSLVIGNKLDCEEARAVSRAEGAAFARAHGALFLEASAKSRVGVQEAFDEMVRRVVESPSLLAANSPGGMKLEAGKGRSPGCC